MAELDALDDAEPFPPHLLARLARLVRVGEATYCELDRARRAVVRVSWWHEGQSGTVGEACHPDDAYWDIRHTHPTCGYRERTGDWTTAHMVADFMSLRDFRKTAIWDVAYRDIPVNDWLDVGLRPAGARTRMFLFSRSRGTFDERSRLVLELLQPYLQLRLDRVQAAAAAADVLATLEGDDPQHVVLCGRTGAIEFASPASRRLLSTYLECENGHVPESVLRTRAFVTPERDGRRLTVRTAPAGDLLVVLLGDEDVRLDRLTPRQRLVLEHVARGETDGQIASSLGIAAATVNKHLEGIYTRLGVHTRTAAAALFR